MYGHERIVLLSSSWEPSTPWAKWAKGEKIKKKHDRRVGFRRGIPQLLMRRFFETRAPLTSLSQLLTPIA